MKLVCFGDSLTYGYGITRGKCWVDLIRKKLDVEVINQGFNGETAAGMISRSYTDIVENTPSYVIIMGGSNDFLMGYTVNSVEMKISLLIKEAKEHGIIPIIGIQTPIDKDLAFEGWSADVDYLKVNEKIKMYRQWVLNYCNEEHVLFIDFYSALETAKKTLYPKQLYIDGIHLTEKGHEIMSECALLAISEGELYH
ncbi:GDSL-type esterase/lipase family protein [Clostridium estertheticum]|uniref:GDSL-type esterase/lipase family protein n=1 Tax=Clostridium estertheticum TaxID=238834 RepID=UPI0013E98112|nr:GDSL-type esterase/lipase family protein [Clostridium estertheticum]MBZ9686439.1 GDSL-type esterase/lipase family protein [Clostridium estertheticum]